jgi:hypothetical protein
LRVCNAYLPCPSSSGLKTESEIGVERNWFVESLARRVKVHERLFARLWILETSMARGPKKSSRESFVVAIEKRSRSLHYMGGAIRYRDLAAFRSLSLMEEVACNKQAR